MSNLLEVEGLPSDRGLPHLSTLGKRDHRDTLVHNAHLAPRHAAAAAGVAIRVAAYDALGREVAVLHDGVLAAGEHEVRFDAAGLAPGPYVVRASTAGGRAAARTVTVAR